MGTTPIGGHAVAGDCIDSKLKENCHAKARADVVSTRSLERTKGRRGKVATRSRMDTKP
jgi:hypothetical protein